MFQKINQIAMFVFIALGVILTVMTIMADIPMEGECLECGAVDTFLWLSYIMLFIAIIAALAGTVMTAMSNPKKILNTAIGIGAMVVIVGISYALASDEVLKVYGNITPTASRWSEAGLFVFYILFVLALLSIVYSSVSRILK